MKRISKVLLGSALAALVSLVAVVPTSSASVLPNCTRATNVEAVIDDSGSMLGTDTGRLRVTLLDILSGNPTNQGMTMGGVEFGEEAGPVFPVQPIGNAAAQASITGSLANVQGNGSGVNGDIGGATNYNAGFTAGNTQNGGANARIFLSDGAPNAGGDPTVHHTPPIKTYVVGFAGAATGAGAVLAEIASSTGGQVLNPAAGALGLQQTAGELLAALNCKTPPVTKILTIAPQKSKTQTFRAQGTTADVLISWTTPGAVIVGQPTRSVGVVATTAKKKVKATVQKGTTFNALHFTGLKKGKKVKFKVKGKKLVLPTQAAVQVIQ
ncbi:MAG: hypothetical protein ACXWES_02425 [Solirubrobacterales bacterium]